MEVHHLPSDNLASWHNKDDVGLLELKPQGTHDGPVASRTRSNRGAIPLPAFARRKRRKKAAPKVRSLYGSLYLGL